MISKSQTLNVWYIYLHLVHFYGKCRYIYHTWILREMIRFPIHSRCYDGLPNDTVDGIHILHHLENYQTWPKYLEKTWIYIYIFMRIYIYI